MVEVKMKGFEEYTNKGIQALFDKVNEYLEKGYELKSNKDDKHFVLVNKNEPSIEVKIDLNEKYFDFNYYIERGDTEKPFIVNDPERRKDGGVNEKYFL